MPTGKHYGASPYGKLSNTQCCPLVNYNTLVIIQVLTPGEL